MVTYVPVDLETLGSRPKPRMSPAGILAACLLAIAIVAVLAYLVHLGVKRKRSGEASPAEAGDAAEAAVQALLRHEAARPEEDEPAPQEAAAPPVTLAPPMVGAVGAATAASHGDHEFEAQLAGDASTAGAESMFGDLVSENLRMEAPGTADQMSLGSVMPGSWRPEGAAATPIDSYFSNLEGTADDPNAAKQLDKWQGPNRAALLNAMLNMNAVDRPNVLSRSNATGGVDITLGIRAAQPVAKQSSVAPYSFQDSSHRVDMLAQTMSGMYGSAMADVA